MTQRYEPLVNRGPTVCESLRIALVDDDESFLTLTALMLDGHAFEVETFDNAHDVLEIVEMERLPTLDVIIADIVMPGLDGLSFCKRLRSEGYDIPFIFLTARTTLMDQVMGLDLGADDFLSKPVHAEVLAARIRALARRTRALSGSGEEEVRRGAITLFAERVAIEWEGVPLRALRPTEYRLIEALVRRAPAVCTRGRLVRAIRCDPSSFVDERLVDTYVARVRKKLREAGCDESPIETVVGMGYRWRMP